VSKDIVFYKHVAPYQRVDYTSNETNSANIHDQSSFIEDKYFEHAITSYFCTL